MKSHRVYPFLYCYAYHHFQCVTSFTGVSFGTYSKVHPSPMGPTVNYPDLAVEKITDNLFYIESAGGNDADDVAADVDTLGNRLYSYEYVNGKLANPTLLLDLPAIHVI